MNKMKSGIYMWTSPSGKSYIGQATDLKLRKMEFTCKTNYAGDLINKAKKKYPIELWEYKVLEYCDVDMLDKREEYYIGLYNTIKPNGYNLCVGGGSPKGYKWSEESKRRLSELASKRVGDLNPFYGKHHKEEARQIMSEKHKGKPTWNKGVKGLPSPFKGKHHTEESKRKLSESHIKHPVLQYTLEGDFVREWESKKQIKRELGYSTFVIKECCDGKYKQGYGFKWAYKKESD